MSQDSSYSSLANHYDKLTTDVLYPQWADYIKTQFDNHELPGNIVLDLACGTGSLTFELANKGYEMIGVDQSAFMLSEAMDKLWDFQGEKPIFLCQAMEKLDLYGTVDACVCCLDSVNYVVEPDTLQKAFARVFLFLAPNGMFLFDIKSPSCFLAQNGQMSVDETEDLYCVWRSEVIEPFCYHYMDLFQRDGKQWKREEEIHKQRLYSIENTIAMLEAVGFQNIEVLGHLSQSPPSPTEERIFFKMVKPDAM